MKKRIVALCLALGVFVGMTACGASSTSKIATITLEGIEYDLSGDFQEVVGSMVADGIEVRSYFLDHAMGLPYPVYDENGKVYEVDSVNNKISHIDAKEEPVLISTEGLMEMNEKEVPLIVKTYWFDTDYNDYVSYEGIDVDSDKDDLMDLVDDKGFSERDSIIYYKNYTCGALYINGKAVDISQYEDDYKDWVKDFDKRGYEKAIEKNFPGIIYCYNASSLWRMDHLKFYEKFEELEEHVGEMLNIPVKEEIMLSFALQDAGEMLEDGEIDSFVIIRYELEEDYEEVPVLMEYTEYYLDEKWSSKKFD